MTVRAHGWPRGTVSGAFTASPVLGSLLLFLAAGCGGDGDHGGVSAEAIRAWGLGSKGRRDVPIEHAAESCNTLIVFAVDRVTKRELTFGLPVGPERGADESPRSRPRLTPHLDAIAAGAVVVADGIAASTGGNASMASLLTGLPADEHGVGSLRAPGRARLDPEHRTLAEVLDGADWHTMASMSSPRLARGFCGMAQGFEDYAAPRTGERGRDAATVVQALDVNLRTQLGDGRKVFALYAFDGPGGRVDALELAPEHLVPHVRWRLEPLRSRHAEVDAALLRIDSAPEKALSDLSSMLRRARGSDLANAWEMAQRDAKLAALDRAVGRVLEQLEEHGREEHAMIAVVGLRGDRLPGASTEGGPRLAPELIEIPVALRYPCGAAADLPGGPLSLTDVPRRIADAFGLADGLDRASAQVHVFDTRYAVRSCPTPETVVERYEDGAAVTFGRDGSRVEGTDDAADAPFEPRTALVLDVAPGAPDLGFAWLASEGRVLDPIVDGVATPRGGTPAGARGRWAAEGVGDARRAVLALTRRSSALRLDLAVADADQPLLERVAIGGRSAASLPLLLTPHGDAAVVAEGETPTLSIERGNGLWSTLAVSGEGEVELVVTVWPPREPSDEVEVSAGGPVLAHDVPGRRDLVRLVGTAPFDLRVKKAGKEDFAIACRIDGRFLGPHEMAFHGVWFGSPSAVRAVVSDWQPAFSGGLESLDAALYDAGTEAPDEAWVRMHRVAPGGPPAESAALDFTGLDFVRTLPPGE